MISPFSCSRLPRILFGTGQFQQLPSLIQQYGHRVLLITGAASFQNSPRWNGLQEQARSLDLVIHHQTIQEEPSPQWVDDVVSRFYGHNLQVVVAIGGGSALDAAKAVAGLLPHGNSVMDHLEGVGRNLPYHGPALPYIAVPTTAGTGSEATKNAVLSVRGPEGFKKSFRHDCLVPEYAIVDPDLLDTCPKAQMAANGMDAFTQLLESYVSSQASPITDALALSGIEAFRQGFWSALNGGSSVEAQAGRSQLAYASLLSGITLAQAGLGSVHGLAAPLGAFFPIPHGVACGTLLAEATAINLQALRSRNPEHPALSRYAHVGHLLCQYTFTSDTEAADGLVALLRQWVSLLKLPTLGEWGVTPADIPRIVANARGNSMKTNPIMLTDLDISAILMARLG